MIVTIDGYAGSGKSTVARKIAEILSYEHLDTGALYRCVTWFMLSKKVDPKDQTAVSAMFEGCEIEKRATHWLVNGTDVTEEIRSLDVSSAVSEVSVNKDVRAKLGQWQVDFCKDKNVVVEGRDSGSVVFSKAPFKFFLTAHPKIRGQRRFLEWQAKGIEGNEDQALDNILQRDAIDSSREIAPLKVPYDAIVVDTTNMSAQQAVEHVRGMIV